MTGKIYKLFPKKKFGYIERDADLVNHLQFDFAELPEGFVPIEGAKVSFDTRLGEFGVEAHGIKAVGANAEKENA